MQMMTIVVWFTFSDHLHECLKREVPVDSLIRHLDNTDQRVLLGSTRLMNAIYVLGERAERICIVKAISIKIPLITIS